MPQSVLIVGEDPELIDFSAPDIPPGMNAQKVWDGVASSRERLEGLGYETRILLTRDAASIDALVAKELHDNRYDVIVVGAGLRLLPTMAEHFERLINALHEKAPQAKLAFNSQPGDSDRAALRWLKPSGI